MPEKIKSEVHKYVFWAVIFLLLILSYFIIRPFFVSLISAFILAYLCRPAYLYLIPKIGSKLSAAICVLIVAIVFILPLGAIGGGIINQATETINSDNLNSILLKISSYSIFQKINLDLSDFTDEFLSFIILVIKKSLAHLPTLFVALLITLLGIYYFLISWDFLSDYLEKYLPFEDKKTIKNEMAKITNTIVYGTILIALIQFIISLNAFLIVGVKPYLLLSALIFFLAFLPGFGPALVWVPLAIYYLVSGNPLTSLGVTFTGLILSIGIDTILRAKLLGDRVKINPLIMLIGILGGITLFGIFGFIIGPLILIYTIQLIDKLVIKK